MTEMFFWIGACGLALAVGAPLVYLALFDPPLEKKLLLVAASACSALILALHIKPDLADRLILGTLQVDASLKEPLVVVKEDRVTLILPSRDYFTSQANR